MKNQLNPWSMRLALHAYVCVSLVLSITTAVQCKDNERDTLLIKKKGILIGRNHTGLGIGKVDTLKGVRINWRDEGIKHIEGVNLSGWIPKSNPHSVIQGVGLGLMPEATQLEGVFVGLVGVSGHSIKGLSAGLVGVGSVNALQGVSLGGLGIASNQSTLSGLQVAGLGIGSAKGIRGVSIAGLGIGSGGDLQGIQMAGLGMGSASGSIQGINLAGLGIGSASGIQGITIAGVGIGSSGTLSGVSFSGIGTGSKQIKGLHLAGIGIGASTLHGVAIAGVGIGGIELEGVFISGVGIGAKQVKGLGIAGLAQGAETLQGLYLSPILFAETFQGVSFTPLISIVQHNKGLSISGISIVRCTEKYEWMLDESLTESKEECETLNEGIQIGLYNYSRKMGDKAWQFGLLNYVKGNRKGLRVLPFFNRKFD
jgi:hypothetical protein